MSNKGHRGISMFYKKGYFKLFNTITQVIELLKDSTLITKETIKAITLLKQAQIETEEMFINNKPPKY